MKKLDWAIATWLRPTLSVLEHRSARWGAIGISFLLVLPSAWSGLALDDYLLLYSQRDDVIGGLRTPSYDLFQFSSEYWLKDGLGLPWWASENAHAHFLRPLTSLTHALDFQLWPASPWAMHLHSILWFLLCLVAASRLYTSIGSAWVAGVALTAFAFEDAHGMPVGWISNRNAFVSAAFAIAAIWLHHEWRRSRRALWGAAATTALALGTMSAELGIGAAAYLFAYALVLDEGSWRVRALSLLPYGVVLAIWAFVYKTFGFGVHGLTTYLDPVGDFAEFVVAFPARFILLLSSQFGGPSTDLLIVAPDDQFPVILAIASAVLVLTAWFVWPVLRANRNARFWTIGALVSLVPVTATLPNDRLLVLCGLGAFGLVAECLRSALATDEEGEPLLGRSRYRYGAFIACVNLGISALVLPIRTFEAPLVASLTDEIEASVPDDRSIEERTLIITHAPTSLAVAYFPAQRLYRDRPMPERTYWLVATQGEVEIQRIAPQTLRLRPSDGFYADALERHYRGRQPAAQVGDRVELTEMTVVVREVSGDGRPSVCDFEFLHPLGSSHYVWRTWRNEAFTPFEPPALGESIRVPPRPE